MYKRLLYIVLIFVLEMYNTCLRPRSRCVQDLDYKGGNLESIHIQVGSVVPPLCMHSKHVCLATLSEWGPCAAPLRIHKMCAREDFVRLQTTFLSIIPE
jgi:hypothetical protein